MKSKKLKTGDYLWKFTSVEDELPKEGGELSILALDDTTPGVCHADGTITSPEWFNKHYKNKWTHWMYLPERPMRTTDKLLWNEVDKKYKVKLPSDPRAYSPSLFVCRECEIADDAHVNSMFHTMEQLKSLPYKCKMVGFAKLEDDVMLVTECIKCFRRQYSHAYTKKTYKSFLNGELNI